MEKKSIIKFVLPACLLAVVAILAAFMIFNQKKNSKEAMVNDREKGFAVVELFTSEGCSSCPPADKLVEMVQKENQNKQVYILTYHVDYWDRLGWKDRYSDAAYSKRQSRYAAWLNLQNIYTPQIIMNGKTGFVGSDKGALLAAITKGLSEPAVNNLEIKSSAGAGGINVAYQTNGALRQSDLVLALVQKHGQSDVKSGENAGRSLTHVQVVRKLSIEPLLADSGKTDFAFPEDYDRNEWELIAFVQDKSNGAILCAAKSGLDKSTQPVKK